MESDPIYCDMKYNNDSLPYSLWEQMGFRFGERGTHTSRTAMMTELTILLDECAEDATQEDYVRAIIDDNCLGKKTSSNRRLSGQRLRELYGLDPSLPIFRILRYCWYADEGARSLLALLAAMARDPLLRVTAAPVLQMRPGEELSRQKIKHGLGEITRGRLNENTLDKVVRNVCSTWTQSGHLEGRVRKIRQEVKPTSVVTAYAIFLGYLLGVRGLGLFETIWARVLDAPHQDLISLAIDAKRIGFLDISYCGGIIEVSVDRMLTEDERRLVREQN